MQTHNPNCAVVRSGDLRAWCDCPLGERQRVLKRLRESAKEFRNIAEGLYFSEASKWELVAEMLEEEADIIEKGEH